MARTFGAIYLRIWRDQDWRTLSHTEQYLYWALVCQPKLNRAGLLEYAPRRWADGNSSLTIHDVEVTIKSLEQRGYVVLDESTNELLIRTYVRNDEAWKQPKVMASVVSAANEIESPKLRHALLLELDRIPVGELLDSPGPKDGPSIRAKVEKSIAQLRVILGGGTTPDPDGRQRPWNAEHDADRYPTDTPGIPEARGIGTHGDTRPVATGQRPAPTPAPEPEPPTAPDALFPIGSVDADAAGKPQPQGESEASKPDKPSPRIRGTRVSPDFTYTERMADWAKQKAPLVDIDEATPEFVDYWLGVAGAKGEKSDWPATWRNRMRELEARARRAKQSNGVVVPFQRNGYQPHQNPADTSAYYGAIS